MIKDETGLVLQRFGPVRGHNPGPTHAEAQGVTWAGNWIGGYVSAGNSTGLIVQIITGQTPCPNYCGPNIMGGAWYNVLQGAGGSITISFDVYVVGEDGVPGPYWSSP